MTSSDSEEQARNVQAFHDCALLLRASGYRPVNPANVWPCKHPRIYRLLDRLLGKDCAYRTVLVYDLWLLSRCDAICLIDGWHDSRGAKIEENFAFRLGIVRSHTYDPSQKQLLPFQPGKKNRKLVTLTPKKNKQFNGTAETKLQHKENNTRRPGVWQVLEYVWPEA